MAASSRTAHRDGKLPERGAAASRKKLSTEDFHVVTIGVSAGGMDALKRLLGQLPASFPAPLLIVQHMSADAASDILLQTLNRYSPIRCKQASNQEAPQAGHAYFAPPDHHLLLAKDRILVTKGARENRSRPAIDPLFRSAAVAYGNRVIGVVLTGYLDDGTAGLRVIQRCGGTCVVQDPRDAAYPDMPQNALNQVDVDYCLPLDKMGVLLGKLVARTPGKQKPIPKDIAIEARIAERVLSDLPSVNALGEQVPFNCPGCGGVLWQIGRGKGLRYRCHTGHSFSASVLQAEQTAKIEETLWVALRMFEENRNLLGTMTASSTGAGLRSLQERMEQSDMHIGRVRAMLTASAAD